jgi:hypothetical protein
VYCKDAKDKEERDEDFQKTKEVLRDCIDKIIAASRRVSHLEFKEQSFYEKTSFSPL